jgi:hypothetical protein
VDAIWWAYLAAVGAVLVVAIVSMLPHNMVHTLGLNNTVINETTCRYTWLGGIDYESFVRDISVDNISVGHPPPGTVIHVGNCSAVVRMYMKDVYSYVQLYPKAGGI